MVLKIEESVEIFLKINIKLGNKFETIISLPCIALISVCEMMKERELK